MKTMSKPVLNRLGLVRRLGAVLEGCATILFLTKCVGAVTALKRKC